MGRWEVMGVGKPREGELGTPWLSGLPWVWRRHPEPSAQTPSLRCEAAPPSPCLPDPAVSSAFPAPH